MNIINQNHLYQKGLKQFYRLASLLIITTALAACEPPSDPPARPGTPQNLESSLSINGITLKWTPSARATSYKVNRDGLAINNNVGQSNYRDGEVEQGKTYSYSVIACNEGGCSASTSPLTVTYAIPASPRVAASRLRNTVTLQWNVVPGAARYMISRSGVIVEDNLNIGTTYIDSTTTEGINYDYEVSACNGLGCSEPAKKRIDDSTPSILPPRVLTATLEPNLVNLTWSAVEDTTHYYSRRNGTVLSEYITSTNYEDRPITEDLYDYEIRSCNQIGCSEPTFVMIQFFFDNDGDGFANPYDVDIDGDGLIEINNIIELNAIRNNLNGTDLDLAGEGSSQTGGDSSGCGGAMNASGELITECSGYELMTNIDLNNLAKNDSGSNWEPIGFCIDSCQDTRTFSGGSYVTEVASTENFFHTTFDGNNHTISNLIIRDTEERYGVGLFGAIAPSAEIRNLHLRKVNITATDSVNIGGLVGFGKGATIKYSSSNATRIAGQFTVGGLVGFGGNANIISSSVKVDNIWGIFMIGGLIGDGEDATISNSSSNIVNRINGNRAVGGLVGIGTRATIISSSTKVNQITGDRAVGGLVGIGTRATIISSSAKVNRINGGRDVGGLVGDGTRATIISSSAKVNRINGGRDVGGLVGDAGRGIIRSSSTNITQITGGGTVGGLVGIGNFAAISDSSAKVNQITGNFNIGGLMGFGNDAAISSSSAVVNQITGDGDVGGLVGDGDETTISSSSAVVNQITGGGAVGGLMGNGDDATISSSSANITRITGDDEVGGLMGHGNRATISYSSVNVTHIAGESSVGGLMGDGEDVTIGYSSTIVNQITGDNAVGGLVGNGYDTAIISSSVNATQISGNSSVGGLVGYGLGATISDSSAKVNRITGNSRVGGGAVGGLVGYGGGAEISDSSAKVAQITGSGNNVGGLVGYGLRAEIISSSAVVNRISGNSSVGGMIGGIIREGSFFTRASISYSSVVVNQINGSGSYVGGLIGYGRNAMISSSSANTTQIIGKNAVGGLIGDGVGAQVSSSSAIVNQITGRNNTVGGLIGDGVGAQVSSSSAIVDQITGGGNYVGGLMGDGDFAKVRSSSAIVNQITGGGNYVGGLMGDAGVAQVRSSSAIVNQITGGENYVGGLMGDGFDTTISYSLAITLNLEGVSNVSGLVGKESPTIHTISSYWQDGINITGAQNTIPVGTAQSTSALQTPTDFAGGIYETWANAYCNPITGEYVEVTTGNNADAGFQMAWDLGTNNQYPTLTCLSMTSAEQRDIITSTLSNAPEVPQNVAVVLSPTIINLTWTTSSGITATHYNVSRSGGGTKIDVMVTGLTYEDTDVVEGTTYNYEVRACNNADCSAAETIEVNYRVPESAPAELTATFGASLVNIIWTSVAGDTTHYEISGNGNVLTSDTTSTSYEYKPPTEDSYIYRVRACNDVGCSVDTTASTMIQFFFDADGDLVRDSNDNCPMIANPNQKNSDNDDGGDACDDNDDNDAFEDAVDVDDDGDGLIEIHNAADLDAVRYNLNGTGLDLDDDTNDYAGGDSTGCGGATNSSGDIITDKCSGYELMVDIDLSSYDNWQPIGSCGDLSCEESISQFFVTEFNGNNYTISNLTISVSSTEIKYGVALFGATALGAELNNVHLRKVNIISPDSNFVGALMGYGENTRINSASSNATQITGKVAVGGLVGKGINATILSSLAVANQISGNRNNVGGLLGDGENSRISASSAVIDQLTGNGNNVGGLLGYGENSRISASSAVIDQLTGNGNNVGGLLGDGENTRISASSAVVDQLTGSGNNIGGLLGGGIGMMINSSLAITASITGTTNVGGLVGIGNPSTLNSYWDNDILNVLGAPATNTAGTAQSTSVLQTPIDFTGIYEGWANNYCNPITGEYRTSMADGFQKAWNLGTTSEYPFLTCLLH